MSSLPISARDTIRFTPPDLVGQDNAPVYLLEVPTFRSRAAFRRELAAEGAIYHDDAALLAALKDGVRALSDETQAAEIVAVIDDFEAAKKELTDQADVDPSARSNVSADGSHPRAADTEPSAKQEPVESVPATTADGAAVDVQKDEDPLLARLRDLAARVAEIEQSVRRGHPPFARMLAERMHYFQIAPALAAQIFLKGWENVAAKFARKSGVASDECLMRIQEDHLQQIGWKAMSLFRPSEAQAKN